VAAPGLSINASFARGDASPNSISLNFGDVLGAFLR
jgi:hypothetical protein